MIEDWIDRRTNLIRCPECGSFDVATVVIPWEGTKRICSLCKHEEIIFAENANKIIRRGVMLR